LKSKSNIAIKELGHLPNSSPSGKKIGEKRGLVTQVHEYLEIYGTPNTSHEIKRPFNVLVFKNSNIELKKLPFDNGDGQIESIPNTE